MSHTKGPWNIIPFQELDIDIDSNKPVMKSYSKVISSDGNVVLHGAWIVKDADKLLIAAAPEMAEALEKVIAWFEANGERIHPDLDIDHQTFDTALFALMKARGITK